MPDSGVISRKTLTSDGMGGSTALWSTSSTVACRVEPLSRLTPQERIVAERVAPRLLYRITVPHDADVIAADRVIIGGAIYEVLGPMVGGAWTVTQKVLAVGA